MSAAPVFNFKQLDLTEEEFQAERGNKGKPKKFFDQGNYDLKIITSEYHKPMDKEPTWFGVKLKLGGIDERVVYSYLIVPTSKIKYGNSKHPTFMYAKFKEFMASIGEEVTIESGVLSAIVPKYFKDCSKLIGKVVNVDLGYEGAYVQYNDQESYSVIDAKGELMKGDNGEIADYADRQSAEADAAKRGYTITPFVSVLKYNSGKKVEDDVNTEEW